jgi:Tol biopolymer transport system component
MAPACAGSRHRISPKTRKLAPGRQVDPVQRQDGKVFTVHPDGSGLRAPADQARRRSRRYFAYQPVWSPDGTQIVLRLSLASTGEQHLYTVRPTGSDLRQAANSQSSEEFAD